MKSVHLVIPDLFLPEHLAAEVCEGLHVPVLEKILACGRSENSQPVPLENYLCELFGVPCQADAPIAAISAAFDGLPSGCWLRADAVHLSLQRDQMRLAGVMPTPEEAAALCASLNAHFSGQGMTFFAPHPQRWYVRLDALPRIRTTPLSEVLGANVRGALPTGEDAARWHQVFNEIQMLLFAHPLNEVREARGELAINSVWFWGGGCDRANGSLHGSGEPVGLPPAGALPAKPADCGNSRQAAPTMSVEDAMASSDGGCGETIGQPQRNFKQLCSDERLVEMFAAATDVPFSGWPAQWRAEECNGKQLLVWTGLRSALQHGDLGAWRTAVQDFENSYAQPLWQALRSGKIAQLQLDILGGDGMRCVLLTRADTWAFWRRSKKLAAYSIV